MLETLQRWLREGGDGTHVAIRLSNASSYSPYILRAADESGITVSPMDRPSELIAYPWPSVFGITDRAE